MPIAQILPPKGKARLTHQGTRQCTPILLWIIQSPHRPPDANLQPPLNPAILVSSAGGFWQLLLTVNLNVVDGGLASTGSSVVPVLYRELTKLSS